MKKETRWEEEIKSTSLEFLRKDLRFRRKTLLSPQFYLQFYQCMWRVGSGRTSFISNSRIFFKIPLLKKSKIFSEIIFFFWYTKWFCYQYFVKQNETKYRNTEIIYWKNVINIRLYALNSTLNIREKKNKSSKLWTRV